MQVQLSKSQIDRLGEQLKQASVSDVDLDLQGLDAYRLSFQETFSQAKKLLIDNNLQEFTQRTKSTPAIIAKLKRQPNTRMSQIQDIVGIRFIVAELKAQNTLADKLQGVFQKSKLIDRRAEPSFGYRAVHLIAFVAEKPIEIQIRSYFQHEWAQLSEVLADQVGHELKYGGGNERLKVFLLDLTDKIYVKEQNLFGENRTLTEMEVNTEFKQLLPPDMLVI